MLPISQKFRASYLKLARAEKHFAELRREVDVYLASEPLQLCWERVAWTERHADIWPENAKLIGLVVHIVQPVPDVLAPIIGDVVHNLRSALDIMMCDVVLNADPTVKPHHINFPCWPSHAERSEAIRKSNVKRACTKVLALIEAWAPFQGGASRIWELSQLDNMDKHRSIIPTITGGEYSEGHALAAHRLARADLIDPFPEQRKVHEGQILCVGPKDMMPPAGTMVDAKCSLAFGEIAGVTGRDLLKELSWQVDIVSGVLFSFETGILPKFTSPAPLRPIQVGNGAWLGPPGMPPEEVLKYVQEMALDRTLPTTE